MVTQGNSAPAFTLETDSGAKVTLSELRGKLVSLPYSVDERMDFCCDQMMYAAAPRARGGPWR